jgi:hypothetical protein
MALSPNYGWAEPDNSSLVKNGASDIRTLGDAIDTSVWNVGYGQAGKNKIINGDFAINQRGWTTSTANNSYGFDRFQQRNSGGTVTMTPQTFTAGAAPVAGYEAKNFVQLVTATQSAAGDYAILTNRMEDVRTFAGQTINISFWAKATSGTPKIGVEISQAFSVATGGSADVNTAISAVTISTSWVRYSVSVAVPSITGKTVGTANGYLELNLWISAGATFATRASSIGIQNGTFQFWGVQVEYGSKATPFQTASGGSPQAELAMCQRYYYRQTSSNNAYQYFAYGHSRNTATDFITLLQAPVTMRVVPTALDYSTLLVFDGVASYAVTALTLGSDCNTTSLKCQGTVASGLSTYRPYDLIANNSTTAFIGFSAEL